MEEPTTPAGMNGTLGFLATAGFDVGDVGVSGGRSPASRNVNSTAEPGRARNSMRVQQLGRTNLMVSPWCLGTNVIGDTLDEAQSIAVLDAYLEAGGNFIDTANIYGAGERNRNIDCRLTKEDRR